MNWLVTRKFLMRQSTESTNELVEVNIGFPVEVEGGDAFCKIQISGYVDREVEVFGVDKFGALNQAFKFIENLFKEPPSGIAFHWPSGEEYSH